MDIWIKDPKKTVCNKVYRNTSFSLWDFVK